MYCALAVALKDLWRAVQGSHAKEFGRMSIAQEHASNFEGFHKRTTRHPKDTSRGPSDYTNIAQRDADLHHLRLTAAATNGAHVTTTGDADSVLNSALENQGLRGVESDSATVDTSVMDSVNKQEELKLALAEYSREEDTMWNVYYALIAHSDLKWTLGGFRSAPSNLLQ